MAPSPIALVQSYSHCLGLVLLVGALSEACLCLWPHLPCKGTKGSAPQHPAGVLSGCVHSLMGLPTEMRTLSVFCGVCRKLLRGNCDVSALSAAGNGVSIFHKDRVPFPLSCLRTYSPLCLSKVSG